MKIIVAGDFCPQHRVISFFQEKNFNRVLGKVRAKLAEADYSIVNFECPVCEGGEHPIMKCGPKLKCDASGIEAVKWAGFNCVTLANNHILDYGTEGLRNTQAECNKHKIDYVGGGMTIDEGSKPLFKVVAGQTLAIINCCEHEFSTATDSSAGSSPLSPINQYYTIREAKEKADYVLLIIHGGHEHFQLPSLRMQDTYRFFIDAGADAVVNHHQHCYSGYEIYKGRPILYGLGNFCFDKGKYLSELWNTGYMASIDFKEEVKCDIIPYCQCGEEPVIEIIEKSVIQTTIDGLNAIIADRHLLSHEVREYYKSSSSIVRLMLEPISNRYIRGLQNRHLLPMFHFGRKHILRLYDFLLCEAHKDRVDYFLEQEYCRVTMRQNSKNK